MLSARAILQNTARGLHSSARVMASLRVAIIGQSQFGMEVYKNLREKGHEIVGVFTIPDVKGKPDILAIEAEKDGLQVFKFKRWRNKGEDNCIAEVFEKYKSCDAELNVLPFCSQLIPMDVIDSPKHGSIIYHPSLLPKHRGASAINWTLMEGDKQGGFTVFWADDGLDTGPILLQRSVDIDPNDTVDTLYNRFLYPEGIKGMGEAVDLIATGKAPRIVQPEEGASYDKIWKKKSVAQINWNQSAQTLHNFIRGNDKLPGAWSTINGEQTTFYSSSLDGGSTEGTPATIEGLEKPAIVHDGGMTLFGNDGKMLTVKALGLASGKMIPASRYGQTADKEEELELTGEEQVLEANIKTIWAGILANPDVDETTDFFGAGAGSMDVSRLVEEVKDHCGITIDPEEVYMNTELGDFLRMVIMHSRGGSQEEFKVDTIDMNVNHMNIRMPHQAFINGKFVDSSSGKTFKTINPHDESVLGEIAYSSKEDVDLAVAAAKEAFEKGPWGRMNARDRGDLLYRLADVMEEHKEELATIESLDAGAVYTLALKTHVGMSISTFRYFAGWCDKIQGSTIPINHSRPSKNLSYTKKEPLGVCALIVPWNYPLMMLAWKMAPLLAAGNTVVLKPAQVTPMTALKFGELCVKAGIPPGVINILPGSGSLIGNYMCEHKDIAKVGFTGSTPVGRTIMSNCSPSLKRVQLELGGKSPLIIFSDCDMERAVRQGLMACFFNKGENCIAAGRLFVEEAIHDEFVEKTVAEVKKMKIGDPLNRSTDHGPQNHKAHLDSLLAYVEKGVAEGATLVYGGKRLDQPGWYMEPAVFTNVQDGTFIAREESFGPIMIISKFSNGDVDGVIHRANDTEYGLASGVFTKDLSKALRVSDGLEAGTCFVNCYNKTDVAAPFGGCKQSGFGKDLGEEALNEYLRTKVVTIEY